jgi:hypothetical protein
MVRDPRAWSLGEKGADRGEAATPSLAAGYCPRCLEPQASATGHTDSRGRLPGGRRFGARPRHPRPTVLWRSLRGDVLWLLLAGLSVGGCADERPAPRIPVERPAKAQQRAPPAPNTYESYGPQGSVYRPYGANPPYSYDPPYYSEQSYPPPDYSERWPARPGERQPARPSDRGYVPGPGGRQWPERPEETGSPWQPEQGYSWDQDPRASRWPEREEARRRRPSERRWGAETPRYRPWDEPEGSAYPSPAQPYYAPETKPGLPSATGTFNAWDSQEEHPWARPEPSRRDRRRPRAGGERGSYWGSPAGPEESLPYVPPVVPPYLWDPYGYPGGLSYPGDYYSPPIRGYPTDSAWY